MAWACPCSNPIIHSPARLMTTSSTVRSSPVGNPLVGMRMMVKKLALATAGHVVVTGAFTPVDARSRPSMPSTHFVPVALKLEVLQGTPRSKQSAMPVNVEGCICRRVGKAELMDDTTDEGHSFVPHASGRALLTLALAAYLDRITVKSPVEYLNASSSGEKMVTLRAQASHV